MNSSLYPRLAVINIKKNSKTYIPYIITCIFTIAMFYVLVSLSKNTGLESMPGSESLKSLLSMGTGLMGIFSLIFIFYTNSFLIKQRKKEFGLFNILGMEKRHISRIMFFENLYVAVGSLIAGILCGMLLNKLMFLLLLKILNFEVQMGIEFSKSALVSTIILFAIIFILVLLNTIRQIYMAKPIELIKGDSVGEREPKNKWILTLVGIISLGIGYFIAVTTKSPVAAINLFFIAVAFVICGTYYLFTAGSITLLKLLRKNKNYYYKTNHFISISSMMYRMKQNAVGLSNICILATAVLVMVSSTLSIYIGSEDILRTRYPRNIMINSKDISDDAMENIKMISQNALEKYNLEGENFLDYRVNSLPILVQEDEFVIDSELVGISTLGGDANALNIILLDDYNRSLGKSKSLNEDEVLMYSNREEFKYNSFKIADMKFKVKEKVDECIESGQDAALIFNTHYIIVKNMDVFNKFVDLQSKEFENKNAIPEYYYGFDLDESSDSSKNLYLDIVEQVSANYSGSYVESAENERASFYGIYGGLFFLGIFLGILFIMATILIMYYKQISEGYDDKQRYTIMKKVGMDKDEIKSVINSQVLTVFFMPLVFAIIHICFAFPVITRLLAILNLTNVKLFAICTIITILAFAICYGIVYLITAKIYYKIVK